MPASESARPTRPPSYHQSWLPRIAKTPSGARAASSSAVLPEEGPEVIGERGGLLHRREVPARGHHGPAPDVVHPLGPRARRPDDLLRERGVAGRDLDALAVRDRPRGVE